MDKKANWTSEELQEIFEGLYGEPLIGYGDIQTELNLPKVSLDNWLRTGVLTRIKFGRYVFISRNEVNELLHDPKALKLRKRNLPNKLRPQHSTLPL